ncbi:MAG: alpha/beta hydrolase family protein [Armatimonadota bacterium]
MAAEHVSFEWEGGSVSGAWHHPAGGASYLVLGHGAGGNMHTPGLVRFVEALAAQGVGVVRFNFPYAETKRKVPDRQATLEACYRAVAGQVARRASRLFLGGRSLGGRMASHLVADGFPAAGLVFLSYPLHPPGQPERLRDAHLPRITVPMLFVQGSRDAFARPDLLASTIEKLRTATLHVLEGGDHSLVVRGRSGEDVARELVETTITWIRNLS